MEFSTEMIKILDYLAEKLGVTIDWTSKNIMPYIEQLAEKYIKWQIASSWIWIAIAIFFILLSAAGIYIDLKEMGDGFITYTAFVIIVIALIVICCQIFDIAECYVFPEKALYDYLRTLLRGI